MTRCITSLPGSELRPAEAEAVEPWPEQWRCSACGKEFDAETRSHPVHMPGCDGSCLSCPIECGPVYEVTAPAKGETE